ncbi:hypothetical protein B0H13DRAFT_1897416 [Mycena leptocephala]|nr:hypothetical protein B0H13DRAFT_1897416 [Mycena leptocephala]
MNNRTRRGIRARTDGSYRRKLRHLIRETAEDELQARNKDISTRASKLRVEEARWREGQAFDTLRALQNVVRSLDQLRRRKFKQDRLQKQNTRALDHVDEAIKRRDYHMESFNIARLAIIVLSGSSNFPLLTEDYLFMKSVQQKRQVGDSKRTDGLLWRAKVLSTVGSYEPDSEGDVEMESPEEEEEEEREDGPRPKAAKQKSPKESID